MKKNRFYRFPLAAFSFTFLLLAALRVHAGGGFVNYHPHDLPTVQTQLLHQNPVGNSIIASASHGQANCNNLDCSICNPNRDALPTVNLYICPGHDLNVPHSCLIHNRAPLPAENSAPPTHWDIAETTPPASPAGWEYERVLLASTKYVWRLRRIENEAPAEQPGAPSPELALVNFNPIEPSGINFNPSVNNSVGAEPEGGLPEYEMQDQGKDSGDSQAKPAEFFTRKIVVWPNPSRGQFQVRLENPLMTPVHFEVLDPAGKVIARKDSDENAEASFDLHRLSAGVYHLVAYSGRGQYSKQILIQR